MCILCTCMYIGCVLCVYVACRLCEEYCVYLVCIHIVHVRIVCSIVCIYSASYNEMYYCTTYIVCTLLCMQYVCYLCNVQFVYVQTKCVYSVPLPSPNSSHSSPPPVVAPACPTLPSPLTPLPPPLPCPTPCSSFCPTPCLILCPSL